MPDTTLTNNARTVRTRKRSSHAPSEPPDSAAPPAPSEASKPAAQMNQEHIRVDDLMIPPPYDGGFSLEPSQDPAEMVSKILAGRVGSFVVYVDAGQLYIQLYAPLTRVIVITISATGLVQFILNVILILTLRALGVI